MIQNERMYRNIFSEHESNKTKYVFFLDRIIYLLVFFEIHWNSFNKKNFIRFCCMRLFVRSLKSIKSRFVIWSTNLFGDPIKVIFTNQLLMSCIQLQKNWLSISKVLQADFLAVYNFLLFLYVCNYTKTAKASKNWRFQKSTLSRISGFLQEIRDNSG